MSKLPDFNRFKVLNLAASYRHADLTEIRWRSWDQKVIAEYEAYFEDALREVYDLAYGAGFSIGYEEGLGQYWAF